MNKAEKNSYLKALVMMAFFLSMFYISMIFLPNMIKNEVSELVAKKDEAAKLEVQNRQIETIKDNYQKLEKNVDEISSTIIKYSEISNFITEVKDNVVKQTGVELNMSSREVYDIADSLAYIVYDINVQGEFSEIMYFLDYMEHLKYRNDIEDITLSNTSGDTINMRANLKVYIWK
ncbi:type 4a pilus biogenesis protein PilO [Patescibacteria group bacterium]|nr:type 4a pilus biogenesis protein PilO [Patescibacteria group bacterium]